MTFYQGLRVDQGWYNEVVVDTSVSGVDVNLTGSVTTGVVSATSVYGTTVSGTSVLAGSVSTPFYFQTISTGRGTIATGTAEAIISGGMFVVGSAVSGTTPSVVLKPAPANTAQPLGICMATAASGATAQVLVQGYYRGPVAEVALSNGAGFAYGSGAALNCIGTAAAGLTRGTVIMGAGSAGVTMVYLW